MHRDLDKLGVVGMLFPEKCELPIGQKKRLKSWYELVWKYQLDEEKARKIGGYRTFLSKR